MDPHNNQHVLIECSRGNVRNVLFNLALRQARLQRTVLYIAVAPLDSIPVDVHHQAGDNETHRINFMYVPTAEELAWQLIALPTSWPHMRPALIVIESLDAFFRTDSPKGTTNIAPRLHQLTQVLAVLHDYARTTTKRDSDGMCATVCSLAIPAPGPFNSGGGGAATNPDVLATLQSLFYFENNYFSLADGNRQSQDRVYRDVENYLWNK